jgi:hypothetical protein
VSGSAHPRHVRAAAAGGWADGQTSPLEGVHQAGKIVPRGAGGWPYPPPVHQQVAKQGGHRGPSSTNTRRQVGSSSTPAALLDPAGGVGDLIVGQRQLGSHQRRGLTQGGRCRAQLDPSASRIAVTAPAGFPLYAGSRPGWPGPDELPGQRDTLGGVLQADL